MDAEKLQQTKKVLGKVRNRIPELTRNAFVAAFDMAIALAHEEYKARVDPLIDKYGVKDVTLFEIPHYLVNQRLKRITAAHGARVALFEEYKVKALKIYDEERTENASDD